MEQPQLLTTQGFQLQIFTNNSLLSIKAQHLQDKRRFHLDIHNDSVAQITNNLFQDVQSMAQVLKDATSNNSPDLELSLDSHGKLLFSQKILQEKRSFSLDLLEEPPLESVVFFQNKVATLEKEIERVKLQNREELTMIRLEYDEKISRLQQIISFEQEKSARMKAEYDERLSRIEQKILPGPKKSIPIQIKPPAPILNQCAVQEICFDRYRPAAKYCEFSDNDKTVKNVEWVKSESFLKCVPEVPQEGKHTYCLKVNQVERFITFGIKTSESDEFYYGDRGCYCYLIKDGRLITRETQSTDKIDDAGDNGSIVQMMVDLEVRALVFFVDGKQVRSCKLKREDDYHVFVGFASLGDSVTLV